MINIGSQHAGDASFRYKMPQLKIKIEGRGNGIKTVILNTIEVSRALKVDPRYPTKFFGIELGAMTTWKPEADRAIITGAFTLDTLVKTLDSFIQKFVLCPTCKLPEIKMMVTKKDITIDCAACGHNSILKSSHKLYTFIQKNPPESRKSTLGTDEQEGEEGGEEGPDELALQAEEAAAKKAEEKKAKTEYTFETDTSKKAQKERKEAELHEMRSRPTNKAIAEILDAAKSTGESVTDPVVAMKLFLASKQRSPAEIASEVRRIQLARGLDEPKKIKVLLEASLDVSDPAKVVGQLSKNAATFKMFTRDRTSAGVFIGGIEELCGVTARKLLPRVPFILKELYDQDVLDEAAILAWADAPPESSWLVNKEIAERVRARAAPFIKWLRSADDGAEDDDEEEAEAAPAESPKEKEKEKKKKDKKEKKSKEASDEEAEEEEGDKKKKKKKDKKKDKKEKEEGSDGEEEDEAARKKKKKDKKKDKKEKEEQSGADSEEESDKKKKKDKKEKKEKKKSEEEEVTEKLAKASVDEEKPKKKKEKKEKKAKKDDSDDE